jgi:histidyl-tRNA synthetase
VKVNNRKVLDGVLEAIGLGGDANAGRRLTVLRAIDKLDKFGVDGVRQLLRAGRWDGGKEGEGDFTKGAGLDDNQVAIVVSFFVVTTPDETPGSVSSSNQARLDYLKQLGIANASYTEGVAELEQIGSMAVLRRLRRGPHPIDPSVVRGLEYYTGPVFEAELLAEIPNEDGQIVRFGSVGGGGRYDGLVSRFRGEPVPATGFSIGVSRLMTALKNLGKLDTSDVVAPVVVLVMDRDTESLGRYQKMVSTLRSGRHPRRNVSRRLRHEGRR